MSIRKTVSLSLAAMAVLTVILGGLTVYQSRTARSALRTISEEEGRAHIAALEAAWAAERALSSERAMVVRTTINDREGVAALSRAYGEARGDLSARLRWLQAHTGSDSEERARLGTLESLCANWDRVHRRFQEAAQAGNAEQMGQIIRSDLAALAAKVTTSTYDIAKYQQAEAQRASVDLSAQLDWQVLIAGILAVIAVLVAGAGWWRSGVAVESLRASLNEMEHMAGEVNQAAGSLASSSQTLASGATRQAASIEETAASTTEIRAMAQRNRENAKTAAGIVTGGRKKFQQANSSLERMEETMGGITESSGKIARIIKVIDDIAFQTNILSLNAAVEAARAGDAGMGFAVVADEVRGLAQRCAKAAQETAELINESINRATEGKAVSGEVSRTIRAITQETDSIGRLVDEVAAGSEDQARAIDQIASSVTSIEQVTQDSASNAEEAAAASEQLTAQAAELRQAVDRIYRLLGSSPPLETTPVPVVSSEPLMRPAAAHRLSPARTSHANSSTIVMDFGEPPHGDGDDPDFKPF